MADAKQVPEVHNGPSQSKVVLAKPRFGGFGGAGSSAGSSKSSENPFSKIGSGSVLRPPQLKPVLGGNPFQRLPTKDDAESLKKDTPKVDDDLKEPAKETTEAPKFVPLGGNTTVRTSHPMSAPSQPASASSSSGFVFGQNLSERAMVAEVVNNGSTSVDHSSTNGSSELLFTSAASNVENNQEGEGAGAAGADAPEGLAAAAAEYERSHARPPVLTGAAAPTTTGEEDETNVLQITCRLFAWEAGSWRERGRGVLRLNDCGASGARLVCRVLGSLRVVLNTKLWPEMVADRAGAKSLRITATDPHNQLKVFLIMATPSDIKQLHRELTSRISQASCQKGPVSAERTSAPPEHRVADPEEGYVDEEAFGASGDECYDNDGDLRPSTDENGQDIAQTEPPSGGDESNAEQSSSLKRKETDADDDVPPKRQCPEILID